MRDADEESAGRLMFAFYVAVTTALKSSLLIRRRWGVRAHVRRDFGLDADRAGSAIRGR